MKQHAISRRDMLKLGGMAAVLGLFTPIFPRFPGAGRRKTGEKAPYRLFFHAGNGQSSEYDP